MRVATTCFAYNKTQLDGVPSYRGSCAGPKSLAISQSRLSNDGQNHEYEHSSAARWNQSRPASKTGMSFPSHAKFVSPVWSIPHLMSCSDSFPHQSQRWRSQASQHQTKRCSWSFVASLPTRVARIPSTWQK
jgi:hypothetical protein